MYPLIGYENLGTSNNPHSQHIYLDRQNVSYPLVTSLMISPLTFKEQFRSVRRGM